MCENVTCPATDFSSPAEPVCLRYRVAAFATCSLSLTNVLNAVLVAVKFVFTKSILAACVAILEFVFPNDANAATFIEPA